MNDILSSGGFERVRDVRVELQNGVVLSHLLAALHLPVSFLFFSPPFVCG